MWSFICTEAKLFLAVPSLDQLSHNKDWAHSLLSRIFGFHTLSSNTDFLTLCVYGPIRKALLHTWSEKF